MMILVKMLANELVLHKNYQKCRGKCQLVGNIIMKSGENGEKMAFWPHLDNKRASVLSQDPFLNLTLS